MGIDEISCESGQLVIVMHDQGEGLMLCG